MVSLSMTLSDPTRILTASRGFVSDSWAFLFVTTAVLAIFLLDNDDYVSKSHLSKAQYAKF